ncbi:EAL domain-containing protein [Xylophilus sp. Kf1]|nr:EAL domain-containing protein [Xylophilus sp. Kf1]
MRCFRRSRYWTAVSSPAPPDASPAPPRGPAQGSRMTPPSSLRHVHPAAGPFGQAEMLKALEAQKFGVLLQPQYSLPGLTLRGFEALTRLHVAPDQWAAPEYFLPLAHAAGLMNRLTLHVIESACRTLRQWRCSHRPGMFIAVNIESDDLVDVRFAPRVCRLLAQYGMRPGELELELVEGSSLRLGDVADANIRLLRDAGVRLAMDDFGTGQSTLCRLAELPFDIIKIDKAFLARIPDQTQACTLMTSVINMCLALHKDVVVEGVETDAQLRWLARLRWHWVRVQGNGLSHPLAEPLAREHIPIDSPHRAQPRH